jgi:hypothetical protein
MAVNPNFTNANANTIFPIFSGGGGGGGSSNFPQGLSINSNGNTNRWLGIINGFGWGQDYLAVMDQYVGTNAQPLAAQFFLAAESTGPGKTGSYDGDRILYQGSNGAGRGCTFLSVLDTGLTSQQDALAFQLAGISSIQSGQFIVNSQLWLSTVKGNNWG